MLARGPASGLGRFTIYMHPIKMICTCNCHVGKHGTQLVACRCKSGLIDSSASGEEYDSNLIGIAAHIYRMGFPSRLLWVCASQALLSKYGDEEVVDHILRHEAWAGQTEGQLVDELGVPPRKLVAYTGQYQIYSYDEIGTNRYRLNVIVRYGVVTGCFQHRRERAA